MDGWVFNRSPRISVFAGDVGMSKSAYCRIDKVCTDNIDHFNKKKYPSQKIFVVKIRTKVYAVPYLVDKERKLTFLKTFYPNRKLKKKYLK